MTSRADGPSSASSEPSSSARVSTGSARAANIRPDEDQGGRTGDQMWSADPASWPDDSWAWPGGQSEFPDEDREPPTPEGILLAFDPDVGAPSPSDPWSPDPAAWADPADRADRTAARKRVPEAFAAGFTHRDAAGWGPEYATGSPSGFAAGGPADTLEPGPVLAGLAAQAWDGGLAALSDDELIGVMCAARRVCSWQTALEFAAVAELDARRMAQVGDVTEPRAAAHTSEELAAALVLTGRAADMLLDLAAGLARLPAVSALLATGTIDRARAVVFVDELAQLDPADAATVAATVLPRAAGLTTGQLRAALRRAVLAFDPAAARRRRERAAAEARVESWQESSGNTALAGRELSPADALAAERHLTALARDLKAAGAPGGLDRLRSVAFTALLSGQSPESLLPMPTLGRSSQGPGGAPGAGSGLAWPSGPRGTVHLTMPLMAWLGLSDTPGTIDGVGAADAMTCRDLASTLSGWAGTRWCLTMTGPDGRAVAHACATAGPPQSPPETGPPEKGPPQTGPPPGRAPPDGCWPSGGRWPGGIGWPGGAEWLAGLTVQWLETEDCRHQRETASYRPSRLLRHLIKVRNPTCTARGCRRQATNCDDDHTIPYDQGGRTCECNIAPLCRRHHRCKQARGWHLEQPRPGVLRWTAPHGRSYVTAAEPYPV